MIKQPALYIVIITVLLLVHTSILFAGAKSDISIKSAVGEAVKPETPEPDAKKPRGQLLYENHCAECHESSVHIREKRKADSIDKIRYWVTRWSKELKLSWSKEEIEEVTQHVNSSYYHYGK